MLEIIVCDDEENHRKKVVGIVRKFMKSSEIEHDLHEFSDYDKNFDKVVSRDTKKIYILDIETPSKSGIDVARMIRKNDFDSIIIFVTGHDQLGQLVLKRNIMCLAFINKFDCLNTLLTKALEDALNFLNTNKILRIEDNNITYSIKRNSILYCTRDSLDRRAIVKTDNNEYKLRLTLSELKKLLGDKFIQTHRSCFVNKNRAEKIDCKKKTVTFDNGLVIDLVSDNYRKVLVV